MRVASTWPLDDILDRLFGSQENRPDEAGQVTGRFDDARVGGFGEDHRRFVVHDLQDLFVQRPFYIVHWHSPGSRTPAVVAWQDHFVRFRLYEGKNRT
jgi:hypothetical protein